MVTSLSSESVLSADLHFMHLKHTKSRGVSNRRIVLLHGAGIPGDLTWRWVAQHLTCWDEIYIPDLPAMGKSCWNGDTPPRFDDYLAVINEWIARKGWNTYDLAGYSFGGLLAMHLAQSYLPGRLVLIEPASLLSTCSDDLQSRAEAYSSIGKQLHSDSEKAVIQFLDLVSPQRNRSMDDIAAGRLLENIEGLAMGVSAVSRALSEYGDWYCEWAPPTKGVSIVGGLSDSFMRQRHYALAENHPHWSYSSLDGTDHGLIYTKPREVARIINSLY